MIRNLIKTYSIVLRTQLRQFSTESTALENKSPQSKYEIVDTRVISTDDGVHFNSSESSVLDTCTEDISHVAPYLKPTFNFAAYINNSNTLQELVKLGVELYKLERKRNVPQYFLQLDFERDIKNHVIFLSDLGIQNEDLGQFITKNPFIFKENLDNLQVRVNYLKSKKFNDAMILRIIGTNPLWLSFSTQDIDKKLGFFQKHYSLTGSEVRFLAARRPKLITYDLNKVKLNTFVFKEEMGFSPKETKQLLLNAPKLFTKSQHSLLKTFEYIHKTMNIPLETILQTPTVLGCREFTVRQRHQFLEKLGKAQFDPKKPNYVSLLAMVIGSDSQFATEIAGSSVAAFNMFLKTV